jgi:putative flippase GtrA
LGAMIHQQFIRYAVIGVGLNAAGYAAYLVLSHTVAGSRAAMTLTYCSGVLIGFVLNRRVTFRFDGDKGAARLRYFGAYTIGYVINFVGLWLLVDRCGLPHEIVQGGMVLGVAVTLFLLQKYWVFRTRASSCSLRLLKPTP